MTDTHSHLYGSEFDEDREEALLRAREAGVERILLPNINEETIALCSPCVSNIPIIAIP